MAVNNNRLTSLLDFAMQINLSSDYIDRTVVLTAEQKETLEHIEDGAEKMLDVILEIHPNLRNAMSDADAPFMTMKEIEGAHSSLERELIESITIARRTSDIINAVALESVLMAFITPCKKEKK